MSGITTAPVDAARFDDLQAVLHGGGDGASCQCRWQLVRGRDWAATSVTQRRELLRREVAGDPAPGLLAYRDGEPAGWVRIGPRVRQERILSSRIVATGSAEPLADARVWAVTCFSVPRAHRGRGVVRALLAAAVEHARSAGARVVEGYPFDLAAGPRTSNALYVGALSTFLAVGFRLVARPTRARAVVALNLGGGR